MITNYVVYDTVDRRAITPTFVKKMEAKSIRDTKNEEQHGKDFRVVQGFDLRFIVKKISQKMNKD